MEESDSWSSASLDLISSTPVKKSTKTSLIYRKFLLSNTIIDTTIFYLNLLNQNPRKDTLLLNEYNYINKVMKSDTEFDKIVENFAGNEFTFRILIFLEFKTSKIIDKQIQCIAFGNLITNKLKRNGDIVISISKNGVENLTTCYGKRIVGSHQVNKILGLINKKINTTESLKGNLFKKYDDKILKAIPKNINMFKSHPLYALPSLLPKTKTIFPEKNFVGLFKGEKVYKREQVKHLYTEYQLYKIGRVPNELGLFFDRINNKKVYLFTQSKNIVINELVTEKGMVFFHENFIPKGCVHKNYSKLNERDNSEVCKILNIDYTRCITKFSYENNNRPVFEGVFIRKQDEEIFEKGIKEYLKLKEFNNILYGGRKTFKAWREFRKYFEKYTEIKKRLNM